MPNHSNLNFMHFVSSKSTFSTLAAEIEGSILDRARRYTKQHQSFGLEHFMGTGGELETKEKMKKRSGIEYGRMELCISA
jgi:hypothetical protein